jgi:hypothetical protein
MLPLSRFPLSDLQHGCGLMLHVAGGTARVHKDDAKESDLQKAQVRERPFFGPRNWQRACNGGWTHQRVTHNRPCQRQAGTLHASHLSIGCRPAHCTGLQDRMSKRQQGAGQAATQYTANDNATETHSK